MLKYILLITGFLSTLLSLSQDSIVILSKAKFRKYRPGYLVTPANDTLRGQIWIEGDGALCFIRQGIKIKSQVAGNFTEIPFITAGDGVIKSFFRNGIFYEIHDVPPYNNSVFLEVMERGSLILYRLLTNYEDAKSADVGINGGLINTLANEATYGSKSTEEFYSVKAYYVQKKNSNELILIRGGDKKFREAFYPVIKDNPGFMKGIVGQPFDYLHLRDLVKLYNATAGRN